MKTPLVTVIVPNYNHESFLARRIDSILCQTINDIEVIVLDDCSQDDSRNIILDYARRDSRVITSFNVNNSGSPFRQWKKGIDLARGKFIWIAESDDYADHQFLERLLHVFDLNPMVGITYCQSEFIDANDQVIGNHLINLKELHPTLWDKDFCLDGKELLARFMPVINIIPNASGVLFKKELCRYVDWDRMFKFNMAGDRYFWCSMLYNSRLCFIANPLNFFRMAGNTVRSQFQNSIYYLCELVWIINWICSMVSVPIRVKKLAVRYWIRHFRKTIRHKNRNVVSFSLQSFVLYIRLLFIFFK